MEVTLEYGLYLVESEHIKLKSDGLSENEYMEWVKGKGICYEDGCLIGSNHYDAFRLLNNLEWTHNHKFYKDIC